MRQHVLTIYFVPNASQVLYTLITLTYLINAQDGINEQEGNFPKISNQAGWNKRAGRANFEAIINKQGGKEKT